MSSIKIAPSLLSADFACAGEAARVCCEASAEYLHFDVMDGDFVPNITFGTAMLKALRSHSTAVFDAHLMIQRPERFVEAFVSAGAQIVTVHCEATVHLQRTLAMIRECGGKAGVALNPSTPLDAIQYVLDDIDLLLIMTVNPGFGGQSLIPATIQKVRHAKELITASGREIELEVDGGICHANIASLAKAGATVFVAGTSIFGHVGGISSGIASLREAVAKGS